MKKIKFTRNYGDGDGLKWKGHTLEVTDDKAKELIDSGHAKIYVKPPKQAGPEKVNDDVVFPKTQKLPKVEKGKSKKGK